MTQLLDSSETKFTDLKNVGLLLTRAAQKVPDQIAVAETKGRDANSNFRYRQISFAQMEEESNSIASGFQKMGMKPGARICLMVPAGIDFVTLVFALFKARIVAMLIDPGMGKKNLIECLAAAQPDGFVTIPKGHLARWIYRKRFPRARHNVVVGGFFPFCKNLAAIKKTDPQAVDRSQDRIDDPAAIIFTTGSTGPPKGVLYRHRNFIYQAKEIVEYFGIKPGGVDISAFPLFALFNISTGCTTVFPEMDFTKPAEINPRNLIDAANDWNANQSFGSPALWNTVSRFCEKNEVKLPRLKTILSAGAPVPPHVMRRVKKMVAVDSEMFTPYGATEALPIACANSAMILGETAAKTERGLGTCVGSRFPEIDWKVIRITDDPIDTIDQIVEMPNGEIGELMVAGPVVTEEYVTRTEQNRFHKVHDGDRVWHRMGDVGYLDEQDRFWFCGRKNHRVEIGDQILFTIPCEAIFNVHPTVYRSALVGSGNDSEKTAAIVVEPWPDKYDFSDAQKKKLISELGQIAKSHSQTKLIDRFYVFEKLPTDIRHNSKIFREQITEMIGANQ
jgi:acyl-CoA synthetase (AMP-forming)/AMP-acid ligase II